MRILFVVTAMACLPAFCGWTQDSSCLSQQIVPGGSVVETRFIAAPLPRVREAVADAMQAAGVQLFKNTEDYLEGERIDERVKSMHLDRGDEEIHVKLDAMTQNGQSGTEARAETFRREMKKGEPKHMWSKSVLDHAACLANVLSIDDPLHRTTVPVVDGVAVRIPDGTAIEARSCHFIFSTDLKVGKVIPFETDALLLVNGQIVAPAGSLIVATVEQLTDSKSWGRASSGQLIFKYLQLPSGEKLAIQGEIQLSGKSSTKSSTAGTVGRYVVTAAIGGSLIPAGVGDFGSGFSIRAGTPVSVQLADNQTVNVPRFAVPAKPQQ